LAGVQGAAADESERYSGAPRDRDGDPVRSPHVRLDGYARRIGSAPRCARAVRPRGAPRERS
jgi:hypothetical protein